MQNTDLMAVEQYRGRLPIGRRGGFCLGFDDIVRASYDDCFDLPKLVAIYLKCRLTRGDVVAPRSTNQIRRIKQPSIAPNRQPGQLGCVENT